MADDKLNDAIKQTIEAIGRLADDGASVLDIDAICSGLENIGDAIGVESLNTRKLRHKLEKRGLRRE